MSVMLLRQTVTGAGVEQAEPVREGLPSREAPVSAIEPRPTVLVAACGVDGAKEPIWILAAAELLELLASSPRVDTNAGRQATRG
jgi:hypothetical protein